MSQWHGGKGDQRRKALVSTEKVSSNWDLAFSKPATHLTCEDCSAIDATVETVNCPYNEDMYGNIVEITVCVECYNTLVQDI